MNVRLVYLVAAASAVLVLSACTSTSDSPSAIEMPSTPVMLSARVIPEGDVPRESITGTIVLDEDCVSIALDNETTVSTVWPEFGEIEAAYRLELVWPNGQVRVGQNLESSSGSLTADILILWRTVRAVARPEGGAV